MKWLIQIEGLCDSINGLQSFKSTDTAFFDKVPCVPQNEFVPDLVSFKIEKFRSMELHSPFPSGEDVDKNQGCQIVNLTGKSTKILQFWNRDSLWGKKDDKNKSNMTSEKFIMRPFVFWGQMSNVKDKSSKQVNHNKV